MTVKEWIKNKGDYNAGVELYISHIDHNRNIARRLKLTRNRGLLIYELNKLLKTDHVGSLSHKNNKIVPKQKPVIDPEQNFSDNFPKIKLADLPAELHQPFIKQKQSFYEAIRLKLKLNALADDKEKDALVIIERLIKLWQFIDDVWRAVDYYLLHKEIKKDVPSEDYSKFSAQERVNERQRIYVRVSKRKKTLSKWLEQYEQNIDVSKRPILLHKINKQKEVIAQLELDIKTLTKIIENE